MLLSDYIKEHKDSWRSDLERKGIRIKEDKHFILLKYNAGCDFSDPVVRESRGIILDKSDWSVSAFPFSKFGNIHEDYADDIDWDSARVQEKVDGSMLKLFWNKYDSRWQWSTMSTIDAKDAECESELSASFFDMILKADNVKDIPYDSLDKNKTYLFELVGPENKVVISYDKTHLYHIGTRDNRTGIESDENIGIEKPKEYPISNLKDAVEAVKHLNRSEEKPEHEGFVVVDSRWRRVKIKSPEYLAAHHMRSRSFYSKDNILDLLESDDIDIEKVKEEVPEYAHIVDHYIKERERVFKEAEETVKKARKLYNDTGSRKKVALMLKDDPYSALAFKSLGNGKPVQVLFSEQSKSYYRNLIRIYIGDIFPGAMNENKKNTTKVT